MPTRSTFTLDRWNGIDDSTWITYNSQNDQRRLEHLLGFIKHTDKCFEIGCGSGFQAGVIIKYKKVSFYGGFDSDPVKIHSCNQMLKENRLSGVFYIDNVFNMNAAKVMSKNPSIILLIEVLEHIQNYEKAFYNVSRLIKGDTTLLLSVPGKGKLRQVQGHVNDFDTGELVRLCNSAGLIIKNLEDVIGVYTFIAARRK